MKHVVFYSWQSDLNGALTRNLIEEALTKAAKAISQDDSTSVEAIIDRDTAGAEGAVGIADTIFQKISECDAFVCDVSFINGEEKKSLGGFQSLVWSVATAFNKGYLKRRLTPNPNVMAEIGFAAAKIGWNRIILVMNTAFGQVESLPFDLRGRRVVQFSLDSREARKKIRPELREKLERALRDALNDVIKPIYWANASKPRWFGYWHSNHSPAKSSTLFIREVGSDGFCFHLLLVDGARTGKMEGYAKYVGPDSAFACIRSFEEERPCEMKFRRAGRKIWVEQGDGCGCFMGLGASFDGVYSCDQDLLFDSGRFQELDLQRLYGIMGKYYKKLQDSFQQMGETEDLDCLSAEVSVGGVKGLYTIIEAIVMKAESGHLWAAVIDDDCVRYFTTHPSYKSVIPETIDHWRGNFSDKEVIFETNVDPIPEFV
ncbi:MAG: hypothetical protein P4M00_23120 [Azospirillaceae bacterium]|nr:hypothetical protein [Azospirillaceae bacterium]